MSLSALIFVNKISSCLINEPKGITAVRYSLYRRNLSIDAMNVVRIEQENPAIKYYLRMSLDQKDEVELFFQKSTLNSTIGELAELPAKTVDISDTTILVQHNDKCLLEQKTSNNDFIEAAFNRISDNAFVLDFVYGRNEKERIASVHTFIGEGDRVKLSFSAHNNARKAHG